MGYDEPSEEIIVPPNKFMGFSQTESGQGGILTKTNGEITFEPINLKEAMTKTDLTKLEESGVTITAENVAQSLVPKGSFNTSTNNNQGNNNQGPLEEQKTDEDILVNPGPEIYDVGPIQAVDFSPPSDDIITGFSDDIVSGYGGIDTSKKNNNKVPGFNDQYDLDMGFKGNGDVDLGLGTSKGNEPEYDIFGDKKKKNGKNQSSSKSWFEL